MYNIQGGFIYIDCTKLSKSNSITIPGIYNALARCNKVPVLVNLDISGTTSAGVDYIATGIGVCSLGVTVGSKIILATNIHFINGASTTVMNCNLFVTQDDVITM